MKAVQLLIESRLPPELRDYNREYTAKSIGNLLSDLAVSYPDKYDEVSRLIGDTGRNSSYWQGDTIKLSDLKPVFDKEPLLEQMKAEIAGLPRDDPKFEDQRQAVWIRYNEEMQRLTNEAGATSDNSIARAVLSGARGKPDQMKMMLTAPGLYSNSKGVVPLFISHSFGEGLRPAEYLASTYGARDSIVKIKTATAKGGDFGKQIAQTAATTIVTTKDCGTDNGLDLDLADPSLRGRVLAKAVGGLGVGTVLDRSALQQLEKEKVTTVIARSAMTCNAGTGVCQQCIGKFHDQRFPKIGEAVGVTAANALSEPVTQGSLGCLTDDTLVRMTDFTTKRIDQIKVGDMVLGSDVKARTFPVKVLHVWDKGLQPVKRRVFTQPELSVDCTDDHIMLLSDAQGVLSKQPAGTPGEVLAPIVGLPHPLPRTAVEDLGLLHCMDISVDHPDELFVLANGLIVKNSKHSGGQTTGKKEYSGFNVINQLVQSPEEFPDRALVSEESGTVSSVEEAPQGGFIVTVGESQHYVPQGYPVMVKSGDRVEAGDQLSEGLIDAGDIVRLRGLGSGRRYFADRLHRVLEDSGFGGDKRNVEIVSRSVIDHARVEDDQNLPGTLPDDQISYNRLSQTYTPPASSKRLPTADTVGQYLQSPALHYSIGTRLSPSQVKRLQTSGYTHLEVSPEEPGFRTEMQRLRTSTQTNPDWLARQGASYLKSNLLEGAVRGQDTNIQSNIHFGPRLAFGKDFGKNTATTGEF